MSNFTSNLNDLEDGEEYLTRFHLRDFMEGLVERVCNERPDDPFQFFIDEAVNQRESAGGLVTCKNPWCCMTMPATEVASHLASCNQGENWTRCVRCNDRVCVNNIFQHRLHCGIKNCPYCGEMVLPRMLPLCPYRLVQEAERSLHVSRYLVGYRQRALEGRKVTSAKEGSKRKGNAKRGEARASASSPASSKKVESCEENPLSTTRIRRNSKDRRGLREERPLDGLTAEKKLTAVRSTSCVTHDDNNDDDDDDDEISSGASQLVSASASASASTASRFGAVEEEDREAVMEGKPRVAVVSSGAAGGEAALSPSVLVTNSKRVNSKQSSLMRSNASSSATSSSFQPSIVALSVMPDSSCFSNNVDSSTEVVRSPQSGRHRGTLKSFSSVSTCSSRTSMVSDRVRVVSTEDPSEAEESERVPKRWTSSTASMSRGRPTSSKSSVTRKAKGDTPQLSLTDASSVAAGGKVRKGKSSGSGGGAHDATERAPHDRSLVTTVVDNGDDSGTRDVSGRSRSKERPTGKHKGKREKRAYKSSLEVEEALASFPERLVPRVSLLQRLWSNYSITQRFREMIFRFVWENLDAAMERKGVTSFGVFQSDEVVDRFAKSLTKKAEEEEREEHNGRTLELSGSCDRGEATAVQSDSQSDSTVDYDEGVVVSDVPIGDTGAYMSTASLDTFMGICSSHRVFRIGTVMSIVRTATKLLKEIRTSVVQRVSIPVQGDAIVFGDLHGQMKDFLHALQVMGRYPSASRYFVFNGDFVDRGSYGCEVLLGIFALFCTFPQYVYMNRGNHEDHHTNVEYGFMGELFSKYGNRSAMVHELFIDSFQAMPLMTILDQRAAIVHGGVPREPCTLAQIEAIGHVRNIPLAEQRTQSEKLLVDLLWNDPVEKFRSRQLGSHHQGKGWRSSKRGCGAEYLDNITGQFLKKNKLQLVIRSHDVMASGFEVIHSGRSVTVFSASNYGGMAGNRGAVAVLSKGNRQPVFHTWFLKEEIDEEVGFMRQSMLTKMGESVGDALSRSTSMVSGAHSSVSEKSLLWRRKGAKLLFSNALLGGDEFVQAFYGECVSAHQEDSETDDSDEEEESEDSTSANDEGGCCGGALVSTSEDDVAGVIVESGDTATQDAPSGTLGGIIRMCTQDENTIFLQLRTVQELRELIFINRYALLTAFNAVDEDHTGVVYKVEWCVIMHTVLNVDLPWYYLCQFFAPRMEVDGIPSVEYVRFLYHFEALFAHDYRPSWMKQTLQRIFESLDLPDDVVRVFCVDADGGDSLSGNGAANGPIVSPTSTERNSRSTDRSSRSNESVSFGKSTNFDSNTNEYLRLQRSATSTLFNSHSGAGAGAGGGATAAAGESVVFGADGRPRGLGRSPHDTAPCNASGCSNSISDTIDNSAPPPDYPGHRRERPSILETGSTQRNPGWWRDTFLDFKLFSTKIRSVSPAAAALEDNELYSLFRGLDANSAGYILLGSFVDYVVQVLNELPSLEQGPVVVLSGDELDFSSVVLLPATGGESAPQSGRARLANNAGGAGRAGLNPPSSSSSVLLSSSSTSLSHSKGGSPSPKDGNSDDSRSSRLLSKLTSSHGFSQAGKTTKGNSRKLLPPSPSSSSLGSPSSISFGSDRSPRQMTGGRGSPALSNVGVKCHAPESGAAADRGENTAASATSPPFTGSRAAGSCASSNIAQASIPFAGKPVGGGQPSVAADHNSFTSSDNSDLSVRQSACSAGAGSTTVKSTKELPWVYPVLVRLQSLLVSGNSNSRLSNAFKVLNRSKDGRLSAVEFSAIVLPLNHFMEKAITNEQSDFLFNIIRSDGYAYLRSIVDKHGTSNSAANSRSRSASALARPGPSKIELDEERLAAEQLFGKAFILLEEFLSFFLVTTLSFEAESEALPLCNQSTVNLNSALFLPVNGMQSVTSIAMTTLANNNNNNGGGGGPTTGVAGSFPFAVRFPTALNNATVNSAPGLNGPSCERGSLMNSPGSRPLDGMPTAHLEEGQEVTPSRQLSPSCVDPLVVSRHVSPGVTFTTSHDFTGDVTALQQTPSLYKMLVALQGRLGPRATLSEALGALSAPNTFPAAGAGAGPSTATSKRVSSARAGGGAASDGSVPAAPLDVGNPVDQSMRTASLRSLQVALHNALHASATNDASMASVGGGGASGDLQLDHRGSGTGSCPASSPSYILSRTESPAQRQVQVSNRLSFLTTPATHAGRNPSPFVEGVAVLGLTTPSSVQLAEFTVFAGAGNANPATAAAIAGARGRSANSAVGSATIRNVPVEHSSCANSADSSHRELIDEAAPARLMSFGSAQDIAAAGDNPFFMVSAAGGVQASSPSLAQLPPRPPPTHQTSAVAHPYRDSNSFVDQSALSQLQYALFVPPRTSTTGPSGGEMPSMSSLSNAAGVGQSTSSLTASSRAYLLNRPVERRITLSPGTFAPAAAAGPPSPDGPAATALNAGGSPQYVTTADGITVFTSGGASPIFVMLPGDGSPGGGEGPGGAGPRGSTEKMTSYPPVPQAPPRLSATRGSEEDSGLRERRLPIPPPLLPGTERRASEATVEGHAVILKPRNSSLLQSGKRSGLDDEGEHPGDTDVCFDGALCESTEEDEREDSGTGGVRSSPKHFTAGKRGGSILSISKTCSPKQYTVNGDSDSGEVKSFSRGEHRLSKRASCERLSDVGSGSPVRRFSQQHTPRSRSSSSPKSAKGESGGEGRDARKRKTSFAVASPLYSSREPASDSDSGASASVHSAVSTSTAAPVAATVNAGRRVSVNSRNLEEAELDATSRQTHRSGSGRPRSLRSSVHAAAHSGGGLLHSTGSQHHLTPLTVPSAKKGSPLGAEASGPPGPSPFPPAEESDPASDEHTRAPLPGTTTTTTTTTGAAASGEGRASALQPTKPTEDRTARHRSSTHAVVAGKDSASSSSSSPSTVGSGAPRRRKPNRDGSPLAGCDALSQPGPRVHSSGGGTRSSAAPVGVNPSSQPTAAFLSHGDSSPLNTRTTAGTLLPLTPIPLAGDSPQEKKGSPTDVHDGRGSGGSADSHRRPPLRALQHSGGRRGNRSTRVSTAAPPPFSPNSRGDVDEDGSPLDLTPSDLSPVKKEGGRCRRTASHDECRSEHSSRTGSDKGGMVTLPSIVWQKRPSVSSATGTSNATSVNSDVRASPTFSSSGSNNCVVNVEEEGLPEMSGSPAHNTPSSAAHEGRKSSSHYPDDRREREASPLRLQPVEKRRPRDSGQPSLALKRVMALSSMAPYRRHKRKTADAGALGNRKKAK